MHYWAVARQPAAGSQPGWNAATITAGEGMHKLRRAFIVLLPLLALALYAAAVYGGYRAQQRHAVKDLAAASRADGAMARVLNNPQLRRSINSQARVILPESEQRCAAVQSLACFAAKGRDITQLERRDVQLNTADFEDRLRRRGWREVRSLDELRPGMICFSEDRRGRRGAADHVYAFGGWLHARQRVALVWDNKADELHPRNMQGVAWYWFKRYNNTPFAFALAPPPTPTGGG